MTNPLSTPLVAADPLGEEATARADHLLRLLLADTSLPFALVIEVPNGVEPVPITIAGRHLSSVEASQLFFRAGVIRSLPD